MSNLDQAASGMLKMDVPEATPSRSVVSRTKITPSPEAVSTHDPPLPSL